jgi:hypothetical protein
VAAMPWYEIRIFGRGARPGSASPDVGPARLTGGQALEFPNDDAAIQEAARRARALDGDGFAAVYDAENVMIWPRDKSDA